MALTDKQRAFVEAYLQCGFNASEAARRAGYSANRISQTGADLKQHPEIAAAIEERLKARAMSANEVLDHLGAIARGDWQHYQEVNESGTIIRTDLAAMKRDGVLNLMREWEPAGSGYRIKWADRQDALNLLAKHHKLLTEKVEQSGEITVRVVRDAGNLAPSAGTPSGAAAGADGSETL